MVIFLLCPHMAENRERGSKLSCVSCKSTNPIMTVLSSWSNYLPKTPSPMPSYWGLGFEHRNWGWGIHKYSVHCSVSPEGDRTRVQWLICTYIVSLGLLFDSDSFPPSSPQVANSVLLFQLEKYDYILEKPHCTEVNSMFSGARIPELKHQLLYLPAVYNLAQLT